jgi:molybdate transport system substrate-binding protein
MKRLTMLGALAFALLSAGCGGGHDGRSASASGGPAGTVTVLAAASLTESFTQIGKDFERANPGVRVTFSFGGSSTLAQQITAGAPADVFAAASPATMKQVTDAGLAAGPPSVFTRNQLVLAVPKGNPKRIAGLTDLTAPGLKVALCAATVPCGAAAARALDAGGVRLTPVTLELDVKAALSKVRLGEVDAALVYRTDVRTAASGVDRVDGVEFPESAKAVNDYPIVALAKGPNPVGAKAFVEYARSESAGAVLTRAGFQRP